METLLFSQDFKLLGHTVLSPLHDYKYGIRTNDRNQSNSNALGPVLNSHLRRV